MTAETDRALPRNEQPLVVTDQVPVFHTLRLAWLPDRAGNWLFHCHRPVHVSADRIDDVFDRKPSDEHHDMGPVEHHAMTGMGGLVLGVTVLPSAWSDGRGDARVDATKRLRLIVNEGREAYGTEPTFGYFLARGDSTDKSAAAMSPGPVIRA